MKLRVSVILKKFPICVIGILGSFALLKNNKFPLCIMSIGFEVSCCSKLKWFLVTVAFISSKIIGVSNCFRLSWCQNVSN